MNIKFFFKDYCFILQSFIYSLIKTNYSTNTDVFRTETLPKSYKNVFMYKFINTHTHALTRCVGRLIMIKKNAVLRHSIK